MRACRCHDPRVWGHMPACASTSVPPGGYSTTGPCDSRCPHQSDPAERLALLRLEALRNRELEDEWAKRARAMAASPAARGTAPCS